MDESKLPTRQRGVQRSRWNQSTLALSVVMAIAGVAAIGVTGCRAYQFGSPTLHRFDIRTVHVAMAESDSYRRGLGPRLTEALAKEIELSTPFRISNAGLADSFLTYRLRSDSKQVRGETINDDPRVLEAGLNVEVQWTDRAGIPLMQKQVLRIREAADFVPEGGQSLATAHQEVIDRIAETVVNQMEMPW